MRPTATTIHDAAAMPLVPWTITRAEWMGQRRALGKHFGGAAFGLTRSLGLGAIAVAVGSSTVRIVFGLAWVSNLSSLVPAIWHNRRLALALNLIWDEQGCVCPGCLIAAREQPRKHGVSARPQAGPSGSDAATLGGWLRWDY